MSTPDYYQKDEDHQSILLLVKFLNSDNLSLDGEQSNDDENAKKFTDLFNSIHKELVDVNVTKINNNLSYERTIRLRFKRNQYELSNNEWGEFQAHRKLFGLITIAIIDEHKFDDNKIEEVYDRHKNFADQYSTLLDSRCLLFKINSSHNRLNNQNDGDCLIKNQLEDCKEEDEVVCQNNLKNASPNELSNDTNSITNNGDRQQHDSILNKLTNCNLYDVNLDESGNEFESESVLNNVKQELHDLVASLCYVLESKRLDKSYEKLEKIPLLLAPFENKSLVGLDTDSRAFKKKCLGRMRKHIGDLCLLVGNPSEALSNYSAAIDLLSPISDLLWLSAALEGQCVASLSLLYPNQTLSNLIDLEIENQKIIKKQNSLKRIFSIPKTKLRSTSNNSTQSLQVTTPTQEQTQNDQIPNQQSTIETDNTKLNSDTPSTNNLPTNRSSKTNLTKIFLSSTPNSNSTALNNNKNSLPNSLDPVLVKVHGKSLLSTDDEIYLKYKEACCNYAKFKISAIIELECSLKAARVLATRNKFLQASEFIQNAAFIIPLETNPEKIIDRRLEKMSVIGQLYGKIGFSRKSAFYQRLTASQTFSSRIEKLDRSNYEKRYYLLLFSIFGYHLTLDPLEYEKRILDREMGWIGIHLQLLQELVTFSRHMGNDQLCMRHLSFILQALVEYLTPQMKGDFARQLELLSSKCGEGAPVPLTLNNGLTIASVNLTKFPLVTKFEVQSLNDHLKPIKIKTKRRESASSTSIPSSPFIFTPIQLNKGYNRRRPLGQAGHAKNVDFQWVQNELCVVNLEVYNPLPIELKVNHMALMTSDTIAFETKPISFSLPPDSGPQIIKLTGKPVEAGKLEILGYTSHVLGVKNNCKLSELPYAKKRKFPSKFIIEVIPSLPFLKCSIPTSNVDENSILNESNKEDHQKQTNNYPIKLYAGESRILSLIISNSSLNDDLIELMNVKVNSSLSKELESKVITFDVNEIHKKLPFNANSSIELKLSLFGAGDFVTTTCNKDKTKDNSSTIDQQTSSSVVNNTSTHKKTQATLGSTLVNFLSDLQSTPRHTAKQTPTVKRINSSPTSKFTNKRLQVTLEIEYTGASGLKSGFCRHCKINFLLEIMPSLLITKWDVLPAVQTNQCYLVFDVLNATLNEMEVFYSSNKAIIIESKDTCRFPVPVERCPLINEKSCKDNLFQTRQQYNKHFKSKDNLIGRIVRNHLSKQVELSWKSTQINTKQTINGNAIDAINQVPWSTEMLNSILINSIQFKVILNGSEIMNQEQDFNYKLGELISISIKVFNWSSSTMRSLTLMIECFQDFENGNRRYNLENKRGLIGSDRLYIEEIKSEQSIDHQLEFLFFYTGVYKIDIRCIRNQFQSEIERSEPNDGLNESSEWRFSPTIEFNIIE